jgi:apolipoprotein N-acyltransferase
MVQARLLSGFAWNFLGVSQWRQVPLIQLAAQGGVYAVSFLMCWASVALVGGCVMVTLRPENRWLWLAEARLPLFAVLVALGTGFYQIIQDRRFLALHPPERLRVALIQPAIPQTLLWDPAEAGRSFAKAAALSDQALATRPEVLVWPEGSFGLTATNYAAMVARLAQTRADWVFSEVDRDESGPRPIDYNAAFQVGPAGRILGTYRKRRLVLFGEYVPLARWLPFLKWFTPIGEGFGFGDRPVALSLAGGRAQAAPIICFEDTFPHGVRDHVTPAVDFLLELTNDAWFGESGAQWQHAASAAFRAVENGVPVVRCTNNGVTGWFDHYGTLQDQWGTTGATVYRSGFLTVEIPLRRPGRTPTLYQRRGDVFGWLCVGYTALTLGRTLRSRRPSAAESSDRPGPA